MCVLICVFVCMRLCAYVCVYVFICLCVCMHVCECTMRAIPFFVATTCFTCRYVNPCDPDHGTPATHTKMEGAMGNFVSFENSKGNGGATGKNWCDVMASFEPSEIPIITTLAEECVCCLSPSFWCDYLLWCCCVGQALRGSSCLVSYPISSKMLRCLGCPTSSKSFRCYGLPIPLR
jgi:hypothetical protein